MSFITCVFTQEKEHEELLSQQMADLKRTLHEREEEMKLAIEERDLQKMAALSRKDTEEDQLKEDVESLRKVHYCSYKFQIFSWIIFFQKMKIMKIASCVISKSNHSMIRYTKKT
jgi:hypothetical protein